MLNIFYEVGLVHMVSIDILLACHLFMLLSCEFCGSNCILGDEFSVMVTKQIGDYCSDASPAFFQSVGCLFI